MSQSLPVSEFKFMKDDEISRIDFCQVADDARTGYIVECDLEYPENLHDLHNDYPLAPQAITVTEDMLSPYCRDFWK